MTTSDGASKENCGTCRFYGGLDDPDLGQCHRYPPSLPDDEEYQGFPLTASCYWCGEWKETREEEARRDDELLEWRSDGYLPYLARRGDPLLGESPQRQAADKANPPPMTATERAFYKEKTYRQRIREAFWKKYRRGDTK